MSYIIGLKNLSIENSIAREQSREKMKQKDLKRIIVIKNEEN